MGSYHLAGPFVASDAGSGRWRLHGETPGRQILLRGTAASAAQTLSAAPRIESVVLEWSRDIVIVALTLPGGVATLTAQSAIVHEPQSMLYGQLPLAEFDAPARKFWKRVFLLLRIPGGRWLLGLMTRRRSP